MKQVAYSAFGTAVLAAALLSIQPGSASAAASNRISADVHDATGKTVATATIKQSSGGLKIHIAATDLPPGTHGIHIHTVGTCTAPDFQSAGGHWNPTNMQHGKDNPAGMHKGDLPNLVVGDNRHGSLDYMVPGATLAGSANPLLDTDGAAVVVHAQADDYHTDPSGNSGGRIACGVLH